MTINRMKLGKRDLPLNIEIEVEGGSIEIRVFTEFSSEVPTMPTVTISFSPEEPV